MNEMPKYSVLLEHVHQLPIPAAELRTLLAEIRAAMREERELRIEIERRS